MSIVDMLADITGKGASDIFIVAGLPLSYKIQGQLITDEVNGGNLFYRTQTVFHYNELMRQDTS